MALHEVARLGDSAAGTCNAHGGGPRAWTGNIAVATAGFRCNGILVAAVGDEGPTSCGHTFRITGGSSILTGQGESKIVARKTDAVIVVQGGSGTITSGSPSVKSE